MKLQSEAMACCIAELKTYNRGCFQDELDPLGRFAKLGSFLEYKKYSWNISVSNLCYSEPVLMITER